MKFDLEHLKPENFLKINGTSYARRFSSGKLIDKKYQNSMVTPKRPDRLKEFEPTRLPESDFSVFFQWPSKQAEDGFLYVYTLGITNFEENNAINHSGGDSFLLVFSYEGVGKLSYNNETYTIEPSEAFIIDCRKPHKYWSEDHWGYYAIYFDGNSMKSYGRFLEEYHCCVFSVEFNSPIYLSIRQLFHINDELTPLIEIENNNALTYIMTEIMHIAHSRAKTPDIISEMCKYMKDNLQKKITLDDLAKKFYLNKYHLAHRFEKYMHTSPIAYLNTQRIAMAQYYLVTTDLSISQISEKVGINSANHFLYLFKRITNNTPSDWRKKHSLKENNQSDVK